MTAIEHYLYNLLVCWLFSEPEHTSLSLFNVKQNWTLSLPFYIQENYYHTLNTPVETEDTLSFFYWHTVTEKRTDYGNRFVSGTLFWVCHLDDLQPKVYLHNTRRHLITFHYCLCILKKWVVTANLLKKNRQKITENQHKPLEILWLASAQLRLSFNSHII